MDTYNRAKIEILSYITSFFLVRNYGDGNVGGLSDCYFKPNYHPIKGDIVALSSARPTEWHLSWYIENKGGDRHLLKSIETGKLCTWTNVGFNVMNRQIVDKHPEWRWTDRQFKFQDRWTRACYKKRDAYMVLPTLGDFKDNHSVVLGVRIIFGFDLSFEPAKTLHSVKDIKNIIDIKIIIIFIKLNCA